MADEFSKDKKNKTDTNEFSHEIMRANTDAKLKGERHKTDEYLNSINNEIAADADDAILAERRSADDKRELARSKDDQNMDAADISGVAAERAKSDQARDLERSKEDAVRENERAQKRIAAASLLADERGATDLSLLEERSGMDRQELKNAGLLSEEVSSHAVTKNELFTRDKFLAIVSHDLKNPLASISMSADILRSELMEGSSKNSTISEFVEIIARNAALMDRLITDLLDVERMSNKKLEIKTSEMNVSTLIKECQRMFTPIALNKSLELIVERIDETLTVLGDFDRLLQVLSNLLGNAIKFSLEKGQIRLSAKREGEHVLFSVADQGPGIPESKTEEIFKRFSQLDTNDRRGLGLGLFISKSIVESHGGKIGVISKVGWGSTFYFTIPNA